MSVDFTFQGATENQSLNLANGNAYRVLRALDIEPNHPMNGFMGQIDAADLVGRIHTALAIGHKDIIDTPDPATKGLIAALAEGGACVTDCSRPLAEYLPDRLPHLLVVAEAAEAAGQPVEWY